MHHENWGGACHGRFKARGGQLPPCLPRSRQRPRFPSIHQCVGGLSEAACSEDGRFCVMKIEENWAGEQSRGAAAPQILIDRGRRGACHGRFKTRGGQLPLLPPPFPRPCSNPSIRYNTKTVQVVSRQQRLHRRSFDLRQPGSPPPVVPATAAVPLGAPYGQPASLKRIGQVSG